MPRRMGLLLYHSHPASEGHGQSRDFCGNPARTLHANAVAVNMVKTGYMRRFVLGPGTEPRYSFTALLQLSFSVTLRLKMSPAPAFPRPPNSGPLSRSTQK